MAGLIPQDEDPFASPNAARVIQQVLRDKLGAAAANSPDEGNPGLPSDPFARPGLNDFYKGIKPPDFSDMGTRPTHNIPQVGRPGSVIGSLTQALGGYQGLRQRNYDEEMARRVGMYNLDTGLAEKKANEFYRQRNAERLGAVGMRPYVDYDPETGEQGLQIYNPGKGAWEFHAGAQMPQQDIANTRAGSAEKIQGMKGESAEKVQGMKGETAEKVARIHGQYYAAHTAAQQANKPQMLQTEQGIVFVYPDGRVTQTGIQGTKVGTPEKPPTTTTTIQQNTFDEAGNKTGTTTRKSTKPVPKPNAPPVAAPPAAPAQAQGQPIAHIGGKPYYAGDKVRDQKTGETITVEEALRRQYGAR